MYGLNSIRYKAAQIWKNVLFAMPFNLVRNLAFLTFFTDDSFVVKTRIWCNYKIPTLVSKISLLTNSKHWIQITARVINTYRVLYLCFMFFVGFFVTLLLVNLFMSYYLLCLSFSLVLFLKILRFNLLYVIYGIFLWTVCWKVC